MFHFGFRREVIFGRTVGTTFAQDHAQRPFTQSALVRRTIHLEDLGNDRQKAEERAGAPRNSALGWTRRPGDLAGECRGAAGGRAAGAAGRRGLPRAAATPRLAPPRPSVEGEFAGASGMRRALGW